MSKQYICIDLKSFYASAECVERGYDSLNANFVVVYLRYQFQKMIIPAF